MPTSILAAIRSEPPHTAYAEACATIQQYVAWIEHQSMPANSTAYMGWAAANAVLTQLKNDAMLWVNQIFPATAQLPITFALSGEKITGQLATLAALVEQVRQGGPSAEPLNQQIKSLIGEMLPAITALHQSSDSLASSLNGFSRAMNQDHGASQTEQAQLGGDLSKLQHELASQIGQLQSEKNKTCPSSSTIDALNQAIAGSERQMNSIESLVSLFAQTIAETAQSVSALAYLNNYWMSLSADVSLCVKVLNRALTDPEPLLKVDLQQAQTQWQQTLSFLQEAGSAATVRLN